MSFERWNTDGDWSEDPWFLRRDGGWAEEWQALSLPADARQKAAEALKQIFPSKVCRRIREDTSFRLYGPVISLFDVMRSPGLVAPLLELGLDSLLAKPWEDASLLARLHQRGNHDEAVFEVRVRAALLRAGYEVERVLETPEQRTCDFLATKKGCTFEIEVKLVNSPELNHVAQDLNQLLMTRDLTIPGLHLTLRGSESFAEQVLSDSASTRERLTVIADAYKAATARLRQTPAPGTYKVDEYGEILASVREGHGSMTDLTLPDLPEEKKARRVRRIIRKGLTQLSGKHTGVLVVGLSHFAHPFRVEQLVSEAAKEHDTDYARCQMITLCDAVAEPEGRSRVRTASPVFHAFSPRSYRHLRKRELELAQTVASVRMRPAARLRPARPGDVAVTLNTARPASSLLNLGTIRGLQAGQTVTFTLNGRGETRMETSPADSAEDE